jgi:hypothetical protein
MTSSGAPPEAVASARLVGQLLLQLLRPSVHALLLCGLRRARPRGGNDSSQARRRAAAPRPPASQLLPQCIHLGLQLTHALATLLPGPCSAWGPGMCTGSSSFGSACPAAPRRWRVWVSGDSRPARRMPPRPTCRPAGRPTAAASLPPGLPAHVCARGSVARALQRMQHRYVCRLLGRSERMRCCFVAEVGCGCSFSAARPAAGPAICCGGASTWATSRTSSPRFCPGPACTAMSGLLAYVSPAGMPRMYLSGPACTQACHTSPGSWPHSGEQQQLSKSASILHAPMAQLRVPGRCTWHATPHTPACDPSHSTCSPPASAAGWDCSQAGAFGTRPMQYYPWSYQLVALQQVHA